MFFLSLTLFVYVFVVPGNTPTFCFTRNSFSCYSVEWVLEKNKQTSWNYFNILKKFWFNRTNEICVNGDMECDGCFARRCWNSPSTKFYEVLVKKWYNWFVENNNTPLKLQLKLFFEMVNFLIIQQEKFLFFFILIKITQIFI
jgi:hypothetical protein